MTYTAKSSYIGYRMIDTNWLNVLIQHVAVPDAGTIIRSYDTWCKKYNIDPNLALGQACEECTYFTSIRWRNEWNPAGLGVTSNSTPPNPFASPDEGIRAHVEHVCAYVYHIGDCPCDHAHLADRRHMFHDGYPDFGSLIRPPGDPRGERRWAVPGDAYIANILNVVNNVIGVHPMAEPTMADIGFPVIVRYTTAFPNAPKRALSDVQWFVVHDTEGGFAGSESVLLGPNASVHALIDKDGRLEYMVPIDTTAWTAGNDTLSKLAIQVELVGFADGRDGGYTDQQYQSLANFFKWCMAQGMSNVPSVYIGKVDADGGPLPDVPGIIGHQDVPNPNVPGQWGGVSGHTDPGPLFDWNKFVALTNNAPPPSPQPLPDVITIDVPGKGKFDISYGFLHNLYEMVPMSERLRVFGYPLSNNLPVLVTDADGTQWNGRGQFFENAVFTHDPRQPAGSWQDRLARQDQLIEEVAE